MLLCCGLGKRTVTFIVIFVSERSIDTQNDLQQRYWIDSEITIYYVLNYSRIASSKGPTITLNGKEYKAV